MSQKRERDTCTNCYFVAVWATNEDGAYTGYLVCPLEDLTAEDLTLLFLLETEESSVQDERGHFAEAEHVKVLRENKILDVIQLYRPKEFKEFKFTRVQTLCHPERPIAHLICTNA